MHSTTAKSSNIKSEQKHRQKNVKENHTQKFNYTQDRKIISELKHWQKRANRRQWKRKRGEPFTSLSQPFWKRGSLHETPRKEKKLFTDPPYEPF